MAKRLHNRPEHEPSQIEWARLAAYIDGEGCILIDRHVVRGKPHWNPHYSVIAIVTNSDPRLMVWCKSVFGGYITNRNDKRVRKTSKVALFQWRVHTKDAKWVIENCLPYFILKHEQADVALAMFATFPEHKYGKKGVPQEVIAIRDSLHSNLRELKHSVPEFEQIQ